MLSDRDPSSQGFLVPSLVPSDSFGFGFSHYSDPVGSDFLVGSYRPQLIASSSATHVCSPLLSRSVPGPISCSAVGSYRPQLIASSSATHVCSPLLSRSLAPISSAILSSSLAVTPHVLTWSYKRPPTSQNQNPGEQNKRIPNSPSSHIEEARPTNPESYAPAQLRREWHRIAEPEGSPRELCRKGRWAPRKCLKRCYCVNVRVAAMVAAYHILKVESHIYTATWPRVIPPGVIPARPTDTRQTVNTHRKLI